MGVTLTLYGCMHWQVLTPVQSATLQVHVSIAPPQHDLLRLHIYDGLLANQLAVYGIIWHD